MIQFFRSGAVLCLIVVGLLVGEAGAQGTTALNVADIVGAGATDPQDPKYSEVQQAIGDYLSGDFAAAVKRLEGAKSAAPELPPAPTMLAQMHFGAGRIDAGKLALEQAAAQAPGDPEAFVILAELALAQQQSTAAAALARQALQLSDNFQGDPARLSQMQLNANGVLMQINTDRAKWPQAERYAKEMLKHDPTSLRAQSSLGRALFLQGNLREAYDVFKAMHDKAPSVLLPELSMGLLYEELAQAGDQAKRVNAKRAMEAAVARAPEDLTVRLVVGSWALDACELDLAQESVAAALKIDASSFEGLKLQGRLAQHQGDPAQAAASFQAAHVRSPLDAHVINQLSISLAEDETQRKLAMEYAQLSLRISGGANTQLAREAAVALAWSLAQSGRAQQSLATLQTALSGPVGAEFTYLAARILAAQNNRPAAAELLKQITQPGLCYPARAKAKELLDSLK